MTPERWQQVKAVFHEAVECDPSLVANFLSQRCAGDPDLQAEVESLLAAAHEPSPALKTPLIPEGAVAAATLPRTDDPMIGRTIGNYTITSELARGGMGIVYRGRHITLPREVVLKRMRPVSDSETGELAIRFRREAHIQCQLDHPHIVRVYEFFASSEEWFLVMEYVPGSSLRTILDERGPLPPEEVARLALQALDALEYAHNIEYADENGQAGRTVVHRDIKPANLLLDHRGNLKLTDFGIAKITGERELTKTGFSPGTIDYMSPEQIRGLPIDARSDLYSLGATLYQMLTGRVPFAGCSTSGSDYDLLKAHVETDPPPAHTVNPAIPAGLSEIVAVSLARDPAQRWQSAADFAAAIVAFRDNGAHPPLESRRITRSSSFSSPRLSRRWTALALTLVLFTLGLVGWFLAGRMTHRIRNPVSVAVLPFADLSPAKDQSYFCQGLAEEVLNELSRVPDLRVIGTASSFQLGSDITDFADAGKKLNVKAIVQGSVRSQGTHARINARLVQVPDGTRLWSATYDVELNDYLAMQEGIAIAVAGALHATLRPNSTSSPRSTNPEALKAYLEGRLLAKKRTQANMQNAGRLFERALALDPAYAKAWAALAEVRSNQAGLGEIPTEEGYRLAREAAQKALTLDPNLSDAYAALGRIQMLHDWDWAGADASFQRTRALEPGSVRAIGSAATLARILGRMDEAVALSRVSIESDPLNASAFHNAGLVFYWAGRYEEAVTALKKSLELVPEKAITHDVLGQVYLAQGRAKDALAEEEQEKNPALKMGGLALAYHALRQAQESGRWLSELKRNYSDAPELIAEVHAFRGETDPAFEWLERAYNERDPGLTQLKGSPLLSGLRRDPRYAALLKKMRLPQ